MTWFAHECWYCGLKSKEVDFLVSSAEYHQDRGESPYAFLNVTRREQ